MKIVALSSVVCSIAALACIQHALATPFSFWRKKTSNGLPRLITLPEGKEKTFGIDGLTIQKTIGYGTFSAMGIATYENKQRLIRCSYFTSANNQEEISQRITHIKETDPEGGQYFVAMRKMFPVGLPHKISTWIKRVNPLGWPKFLSPNFGRCIIMDYAGERTLDDYLGSVTANRYQIIFDLFFQILKGKWCHAALSACLRSFRSAQMSARCGRDLQ
ncbi:hypothetical protein SYNPS1DRAFT_29535 [Syncephalis pseudoplumigaleata]|uniref:Protein kinase domain-containing protein n=1 Tax=Syncephalis pseudoplumigaleata TaxID=1712513 RepID=A0A4P9Z056_9FUNG|nr:hypothetical protein SYNPS1DRAFT_29535 [Syncephalis pseudoplumigaleata]|eukprot:RKP24710.1 hypothetical protein SYNPS1DRAFT_29535 [Syncephalis pseudoplumigaleata]